MLQYSKTYPITSKQGRMILILVSSLFLLLGVTFSIIPFMLDRAADKKLERCTAEVQALVTDLVAKEFDSDDDYNASAGYAPVLTFTDENGRERTVHSTVYSYPPVCEKGDTVRILYDPNDPSTFVLPDNDDAFSIVSRVFRFIGAIQTVVAIILLAVAIAAKKRKEAAEYDPLDEFR